MQAKTQSRASRIDADAILRFLRMPREEPSYDYLSRLLISYRDRVPYETATRLLRYRDIPVPEDHVRLPDEFWREKLTLGAGGSCSDSTYAFKKLLDVLGFDCATAIGSEGEVERDAEGNVLGFPKERSHCSVIVRLGEDRYVVDPCCGHYIKVPLPIGNAGRVDVRGRTDAVYPYHYAVEPLGDGYYEIHDIGPGGSPDPEDPARGQVYIFRDHEFSDEEFEEHMRYGYRHDYSSDHLSFVRRDKDTKIEYRYGSHSGELKRNVWGTLEEVPLGDDPVATLSRASGLPHGCIADALEYLASGGAEDDGKEQGT